MRSSRVSLTAATLGSMYTACATDRHCRLDLASPTRVAVGRLGDWPSGIAPSARSGSPQKRHVEVDPNDGSGPRQRGARASRNALRVPRQRRRWPAPGCIGPCDPDSKRWSLWMEPVSVTRVAAVDDPFCARSARRGCRHLAPGWRRPRYSPLHCRPRSASNASVPICHWFPSGSRTVKPYPVGSS